MTPPLLCPTVVRCANRGSAYGRGVPDRRHSAPRRRCRVDSDEVHEVLDALRRAGLRQWIDGGWGIDALLERQTRVHDDLDLIVELCAIDDVVAALQPFGFVLTEDYLPTRAVLRTMEGLQIDLHPVTFDKDGVGWQSSAGPHGEDCAYPADGFAIGAIAGRLVPCLSAQVQVAHHTGYEPRDRDRKDMHTLANAFGVSLPEAYV